MSLCRAAFSHSIACGSSVSTSGVLSQISTSVSLKSLATCFRSTGLAGVEVGGERGCGGDIRLAQNESVFSNSYWEAGFPGTPNDCGISAGRCRLMTNSFDIQLQCPPYLLGLLGSGGVALVGIFIPARGTDTCSGLPSWDMHQQWTPLHFCDTDFRAQMPMLVYLMGWDLHLGA